MNAFLWILLILLLADVAYLAYRWVRGKRLSLWFDLIPTMAGFVCLGVLIARSING